MNHLRASSCSWATAWLSPAPSGPRPPQNRGGLPSILVSTEVGLSPHTCISACAPAHLPEPSNAPTVSSTQEPYCHLWAAGGTRGRGTSAGGEGGRAPLACTQQGHSPLGLASFPRTSPD